MFDQRHHNNLENGFDQTFDEEEIDRMKENKENINERKKIYLLRRNE